MIIQNAAQKSKTIREKPSGSCEAAQNVVDYLYKLFDWRTLYAEANSFARADRAGRYMGN